MRANYHTHTYRCGHAVGSEEDYVKAAIANDLDILGISEHGPFIGDKFGFRMCYDELPEYVEEINRLKEAYKNEIIILSALEIEYLPESNHYYEQLLTTHGLDYLALGQHMFRQPWLPQPGLPQPGLPQPKKLISIFDTRDTETYVMYARSVVEAMQTRYFKFIAHPDVMFINEFAWDYHCDKACDIIVNGAVRTGTILEFNANGFRRGLNRTPDGLRYPYPYKKFWDKVRETEIQILINSDCHSPKQIWDRAMNQAYEVADQWGLVVCRAL